MRRTLSTPAPGTDASPASDSAPRRRPPRHTAFLVLAGIVPLIVAGGAAAAITGINHFETVLQKIDVGPSCVGSSCLRDIQPGPCVRNACNFLVLGSDSRSDIPKNEQGGVIGSSRNITGQRSDTIMVVQTDLENKRTVVLSIPRDLRVEIPGHGMGKINTAFSYPGGANLMVKTVEKLTGLQINHYVQVNFVGFQNLVNALGGVPVCIDQPMIDTYSGLKLAHAGCYNLKGAQALAFVRARHVQGDTIPDFSRIARQQQFTRAIINKVMSAGAILHYPEIVKAVSKDLVVDKRLNLYDLQDLTTRLSRLGQKSVIFRVVPALPTVIDGVDYVEATPGAEVLFDRVRTGAKDLSIYGRAQYLTDLSPAEISVRIYDSSSNGKAQQVAAYLQKAGFVVGPVESPPPTGLLRNTLYWGHRAGNEQKVFSSYLPTLQQVYDNQVARGREMTIVIGPGFSGLEGLTG
jgi:LCP family protein required for cell wall assembly